MRVLLTNDVPSEGTASGADTMCLAQGLQAAEHAVHCLLLDNEPRSSDPFSARRLICDLDRDTADLFFPPPTFSATAVDSFVFSDLTDEQVAEYREVYRRALEEEVDKFDPQIIHCQHAWLQANLALETGVPYVLTARWKNIQGYRSDARFRFWVEQAVENAARVVVHNHFMAGQVKETFEIDNDRIVVIPQAVHVPDDCIETANRSELLQHLGVDAGPGPLITFGGKLLAGQGVEELLLAAHTYESRMPGVTTVILGDGQKFTEYQSLARKLRLRWTYLVGDCGLPTALQLYSVSDLVVVPAPTEPLMRTPIYGLACGTPVIACDVAGMSELITSAVGGLAPAGDPQAVAELVLQALHEGWKRTKGEAARRLALTHFGVDAWVERLVEIYEQVVFDRCG